MSSVARTGNEKKKSFFSYRSDLCVEKTYGLSCAGEAHLQGGRESCVCRCLWVLSFPQLPSERWRLATEQCQSSSKLGFIIQKYTRTFQGKKKPQIDWSLVYIENNMLMIYFPIGCSDLWIFSFCTGKFWIESVMVSLDTSSIQLCIWYPHRVQSSQNIRVFL